MKAVSKCVLLPIDDTDECLKPVDFLTQLYPKYDHIDLLLSYLLPPLAPIYQQRATSPQMIEKKRAVLQTREETTRRVLDRARQFLLRKGFADELIQEHIQEKELSVAHHA